MYESVINAVVSGQKISAATSALKSISHTMANFCIQSEKQTVLL